MPDENPPSGPPDGPDPRELAAVDDLVEALARSVHRWLIRCVVDTATRQLGECPDGVRAAAETMAEEVAPGVVAEIEALVRTDVERQRATPLTMLRDAVRHPTAVLVTAGVPPVPRDPFVADRFPADRYDLAPATWADVDPELHEPGLLWGAAKAAAVLRRHRSDPRAET